MGGANTKTTETCTLASKGQRVVPGPSWWSYRTIAPGYVGTVLAANPSHGCEDAGVVVLWDSGVLATYPSNRTGFSPLRLYDSGPTGVNHGALKCMECMGLLVGTRWKCSSCWEYNMCHPCYMDDKHSLEHAFYRFDVPGGPGVEVPPRSQSQKMQVLGIFTGAKVLRGEHWIHNKEVEAGCIGTVLRLGDADDGSKRNKASVQWTDSFTSTCCVGHGGCVEIKCTQATSGGYFYSDHMPLIAPAEPSPGNFASGDAAFRCGDQVAIMLDVDTLRQLQKEHGEMDPRLEKDTYRLGTVQDVIWGGDLSVAFGIDVRWPVRPRVLTKVPLLGPGDKTTIIDDFDTLKKFQVDHGGHVEAMRNCLGKTGVVLKVFPTQDVRVMVCGAAWTFNRFCLRFTTDTSNSDISVQLREAARQNGLCDAVALILPTVLTNSGQVPPETSDRDPTKGQQLREVTATSSEGQNQLMLDDSKYAKPGCSKEKSPNEKGFCSEENIMEGLVRVIRDWANIYSNEGSARGQKNLNGMPLHLACHSGRVEVVQLLARSGANLEKPDNDGDRPLHYAVYGNEAPVVQLLLSLGVAVNATNTRNRTALHVAANKAFLNCVRELVKYTGELNVNIQDDCGCTALHEAVGSNIDILHLLLEYPGADLHIKDNNGFNVLHLAAVKGNTFAAEAIVSEAPELAVVKDKDGYTPLHWAAMNGHYQLVSILLNQGDCEVDDLSKRQRTALWLAVSEGHLDVVELLVKNGADVNLPDEDGNSPMHMSLLKRSEVQFHAIDDCTAPVISAIVSHLLDISEPGIETSLAPAWFLAMKGGDLHQMNTAGITPLEMASNLGENVEESLLIWKTAIRCESDLRASSEFGGASGTTAPENGPMNRSHARQENTEAKALRSRLREIRSKYQEVEEALICSICSERQRDVAFICGHRACAECARRLTECPWCRRRITDRITLY